MVIWLKDLQLNSIKADKRNHVLVLKQFCMMWFINNAS
jgi:hypothetical protein